MKTHLFLALLLLIVGLVSGCSRAYDSEIGSDGRRYYNYACADFDDCMYGVRDKCSGAYDVINLVGQPTVPGKAPVQVYFPGSEAMSGGGRVLFTCDARNNFLTSGMIREDIEQLKDELNY